MKNKYFIPHIILLLTTTLLFFYEDAKIAYIIGTLCCVSIGFFVSLKDLKMRFSLFSFNIGFFVFLVGGFLLELLQTKTFSFFSNSYFTSSSVAIQHAMLSHHSCGKLCATLSCRELFLDFVIRGGTDFMEEKKEVKYLDLCADTQLDLKEILERLMNPSQRTAKEDKENDDNG